MEGARDSTILANRLLKNNKVKPIGSLFFGGLFILYGFWQGGLVIQWLILLLLAIYLLAAGIAVIWYKRWQSFLISLAIWGVAIMIGFAGQYYLYYAWQQKANSAIVFLEKYKQQRGQYPTTADFYKFFESNSDKSYRSFYTCNEKTAGLPYLMYIGPNMPFSTYHYDFDKKQWRYFAD